MDGLENILTSDNFSALNKEFLEKLDLKTGKIVATSNECGKIINNFECYIATISKSNEAKEATVGKKINELINYRKISFDLIWWSYSGLKIPNQAIVEEDGINYVVRNRAGYLDKIPVNIKKQNDKYSIIKNYTAKELKELGISTEIIKKFKTINLYDEIIIKPDLRKIN